MLDGFQYRNIKGTRYEKKLEPIFVSKDIPTPPVAVVEGRVDAKLAETLGAALVDMQNNPEGQGVLKLFRIEGFAKPDVAAYKTLQGRLRAKK